MTNKVAVFITNLNMPEAADAAADYLSHSQQPHDLYLVDNGSDLMPPAEHTNVQLLENVQTTNGWLAGVDAARASGEDYFAYVFIITSMRFISGDPLFSMARFLHRWEDAVGVHPALTQDSTTAWEHLKLRPESPSDFRRVFMLDNICSMWRRDWWEAQGGFDERLIYGWGIDLELSLLARRQGRSLWVDETCQVRKITDVGYSLGRMHSTAEERRQKASANMAEILSEKYGAGWNNLMRNEGVRKNGNEIDGIY